MPNDDNTAGRRIFIGIGVGEYDDAMLNLENATGDVEKVSEWFTGHLRVPHTRALESLANNPTVSEIGTQLRDFFEECTEQDVVVVWVACHGALSGSHAHLFGRDTPATRFAGRSLQGDTLGQIIGQARPHNVLVVIDACIAGRLASDVQFAAESESRGANNRDLNLHQANAILASAYDRDPAHDGKFAEAFLRVVTSEPWTGTTAPWISVDQLIRGLNEELRNLKVPQVADRRVWGPNDEQLVPNPHYEKRQLQGLIADEEFRAHFGPAERGVRDLSQKSFFMGRDDELRTITSWLLGTEPAMLLITGSPGCGKSALLSRAVVLSEPTRRPAPQVIATLDPTTVPSLGSFDGVIWCRNKSTTGVIGELAQIMGGVATSVDELVELADTRSFTIAIDSLDEAIDGHASVLARDVFRPLVDRSNGVRLLIASREKAVHGGTRQGSLPQHLAAEDTIILDRVKDHQLDMRRYVDALLADNKAVDPASGDVDALAAKIVDAADRSFLVASLVARSASVMNSDGALPSEVGDALGAYIDRLPDPERARWVLGPLAWAQGMGLPWAPFWPLLATKMLRIGEPGTRRRITDRAIEQVLTQAGDLIIESDDGGRPVYRLFHEALAEHLRNDFAPHEVHKAFVEVLQDLHGDRRWADADSYTLRSLPSHLRWAGETEQLVAVLSDPTWDRAMRERSRDPLAALSEASDSINYLMGQGEPFSLEAVPLCVGYSRAVSTAAPLIIEVFALAGQTARALAMANNLTTTPDRILAHRLLAKILAAEGDHRRAAACVDEVECSLATMHESHLPMGYFSLAKAASDAGLVDRAQTACTQAVAAALAAGVDPWDVPNGIFWAGLACRIVGDAGSLDELRACVESEDLGASFRNQLLQAAAVVGATTVLEAETTATLAGNHYPGGPIRIGNLALALADAGLTEQFDQIATMLGSSPPVGQPDSMKRWAWALALVGRTSEALAALQHIGDRTEWSKAISRLVAVAEANEDEQALEKLAEQIGATVFEEDDARVEARLINSLWRTGKRDEALEQAERHLASLHRTRPVADPRDGGFTATTSVRGKAGRREMPSTVTPVQDQMVALEVASLALAGDLAAAREQASTIVVPMYQARALGDIARAQTGPAALTTWLQALAAASASGPAPVQEVLPLGLELLRNSGRSAEADQLDERVNRVNALWEIEAFAEQYSAMRRTMPPGRERSLQLDNLLLSPHQLAERNEWTSADIDAAWGADGEGKRLFALVVITHNPELATDEILIEAIRSSRTAYEQYVALEAATACASGGEISTEVLAAIQSEVDGDQRPDNTTSNLADDADRMKLAAELMHRPA